MCNVMIVPYSLALVCTEYRHTCISEIIILTGRNSIYFNNNNIQQRWINNR